MVEGGGGRAFPVVFFDGERETNVGEVKISPPMEYKLFRMMLSQKIGISPNQMSIYLVDRKRSPKSPISDVRRRTPINGKVDFGLICRQKDCCFLVVKRLRKPRNRRERATSGGEFANFLTESEHSAPPLMDFVPENLILLRRNQQLPLYDKIAQSDLSNPLQSLSIQRGNKNRYQHQMALANGSLTLVNSSWFHCLESQSLPNLSITDSTPEIIDDWYKISSTMITTTTSTHNKSRKAFCEECVNEEKNRSTTSFHHCVNDVVVSRFATRMGPINRPNKLVCL